MTRPPVSVAERVRGGEGRATAVHVRVQRQSRGSRRHGLQGGALDGRPLPPPGGQRARLRLAAHGQGRSPRKYFN